MDKEKEVLSKEEKDLRINEANSIKGLMTHTGFKILQKELDRIRDQAFADLTNEDLLDETLKARQVVYNQIVDLVNLPNQIIKLGEDAEAEKDEPEREERPIKRGIPFIGRR